MGDDATAQHLRWRRPSSEALWWLALAALTIVIALGPAPVFVPAGMGVVLVIVYVAAYGPWGWKRSRGWLSAVAPVVRLVAWYGYGHTRAELVLRPRVVLRVILWPLLPWTMYCRVELIEDELISYGHPLQRNSVSIDASTSLRLARDQRFAAPHHNIYRVLTITHPRGGRIRLSVAVWSHWRQLVQVLDPQNRLGLDLIDWAVEPFEDDNVDRDGNGS